MPLRDTRIITTTIWSKADNGYVSVAVRLDIDFAHLARRFSSKALNSKAGKSTALNGAITATIVK